LCYVLHYRCWGRYSTGIGNFGRLKAQEIKSLVTRSAHRKRESSNRSSTNRSDESSFDGSDDEEESYFERRKPERRTKLSSDGRTRSAHSLTSVLGQYRGDDDTGFPASEATSGSKGWGNVADVTYGRQNQKQREPLNFPQRKGPLDSGFFSRTTFKEIGCSDEILGALRNFDFPRPSHIQVNIFALMLYANHQLLGALIYRMLNYRTHAFINCPKTIFRLWHVALSWRGGVVLLLIKVGLARHWHIFAL
jgi:ATP-dependent RNA helicase DDX18/HAS1